MQQRNPCRPWRPPTESRRRVGIKAKRRFWFCSSQTTSFVPSCTRPARPSFVSFPPLFSLRLFLLLTGRSAQERNSPPRGGGVRLGGNWEEPLASLMCVCHGCRGSLMSLRRPAIAVKCRGSSDRDPAFNSFVSIAPQLRPLCHGTRQSQPSSSERACAHAVAA